MSSSRFRVGGTVAAGKTSIGASAIYFHRSSDKGPRDQTPRNGSGGQQQCENRVVFIYTGDLGGSRRQIVDRTRTWTHAQLTILKRGRKNKRSSPRAIVCERDEVSGSADIIRTYAEYS